MQWTTHSLYRDSLRMGYAMKKIGQVLVHSRIKGTHHLLNGHVKGDWWKAHVTIILHALKWIMPVQVSRSSSVGKA